MTANDECEKAFEANARAKAFEAWVSASWRPMNYAGSNIEDADRMAFFGGYTAALAVPAGKGEGPSREDVLRILSPSGVGGPGTGDLLRKVDVIMAQFSPSVPAGRPTREALAAFLQTRGEVDLSYDNGYGLADALLASGLWEETTDGGDR